MASGFQQDTNQLSPDFYRVVLTLSGGTGAYNAAAQQTALLTHTTGTALQLSLPVMQMHNALPEAICVGKPSLKKYQNILMHKF